MIALSDTPFVVYIIEACAFLHFDSDAVYCDSGPRRNCEGARVCYAISRFCCAKETRSYSGNNFLRLDAVGRGNVKGKRPRGAFSSKTVSDMIKDEVAQ